MVRKQEEQGTCKVFLLTDTFNGLKMQLASQEGRIIWRDMVMGHGQFRRLNFHLYGHFLFVGVGCAYFCQLITENNNLF